MPKKLTNKEIQERLDMLLRRIMLISHNFENLQKVFALFINYKGESLKFKKYLEKQGEKNGTHKSTTSKKSTKGNENTSRGKQSSKKTKSKSKEPVRASASN